jgi:spore coat protein U-like protein
VSQQRVIRSGPRGGTLRYLLGAILAVSSTAQAGQATTTFTVSATVSDSCTVSATDLNFGAINVVADRNFDAQSTVTATCSSGTVYSIGLDGGTGGPGTTTDRKMTDASTNTLSYGLYIDSGRTSNWDDIGGSNVVSDTGTGSAQSHTVYGRVPSGQTAVPASSYSDTITVTIAW